MMDAFVQSVVPEIADGIQTTRSAWPPRPDGRVAGMDDRPKIAHGILSLHQCRRIRDQNTKSILLLRRKGWYDAWAGRRSFSCIGARCS
jgi:hypothetical protein